MKKLLIGLATAAVSASTIACVYPPASFDCHKAKLITNPPIAIRISTYDGQNGEDGKGDEDGANGGDGGSGSHPGNGGNGGNAEYGNGGDGGNGGNAL